MKANLAYFLLLNALISCSKDESEIFLQSIKNIENGPIIIQTYDGSNQVVHPDVIWDEANEKFWLAITPYPDFNDDFENPSLYFSKDGMHFQSNGIENPLKPEPNNGFNCDPDVFIEHDGSLKMTYMETTPPSNIAPSKHFC